VNRTHCGRRYATSPLPIFIALAFAPIAPNAFALGSDTVFINGNAGVMYDSNLYRLSDSLPESDVQQITHGHTEKDDTVFTVGAGVNADVPYSLQRFQANLRVTDYRYSRNTNLDYVGGAGGATWLWQVGQDWNGDVGATFNRSLQSFTYAVTTQRDVINTISYFADPKYRIAPNWEVNGGASYTTVRNELASVNGNDTDTATFYGGTRYITPSGSSVGLRAQTSNVRFPNVIFVQGSLFDNAYRENRLATDYDWTFSGASKIDGSWGYNERRHDNLPQRDFSGWTGSLGWTWTPSGKSSIRTYIARDVGGVEDLAVTYARTYTFFIKPTYQLTDKVALNGTLEHQDLRFLGNPDFGIETASTGRHDRINLIGAGAKYQATRVLTFNLNYSWSHRLSNVQFGDFNDQTISLNGQITF
jgi:exopolysaccharide biosynthesis operon protein EpsL